jgi:hypothetical protein
MHKIDWRTPEQRAEAALKKIMERVANKYPGYSPEVVKSCARKILAGRSEN